MVITTKKTTTFHLNARETETLLVVLNFAERLFEKGSPTHDYQKYKKFSENMCNAIKKSFGEAK